jgi:FkbM family methyltransferase
MSTYVLLEQEDWFEKELDFVRRWLRPGMTVIDVGANVGIYSIAAARLVGPAGCVFAYEPGADARALLERSRRLNRADCLTVLPFALSDRKGAGFLVHGGWSELHALGPDTEGQAGETVPLTTLDAEAELRGWPPPDLLKLDAEGEEERVLAGGHELLACHSPLVLIEVKAGATVNHHLTRLLRDLGYGIYRLLGGAPVLVPVCETEPFDAFEINFFAAKPDRAEMLAAEGMLVPEAQQRVEHPPTQALLVEALSAMPCAEPFRMARALSRADPAYAEALASFAMWRNGTYRVAERCAALGAAFRGLRALCAHAASFARLSSFARVAWEAGHRQDAVEALTLLLAEAKRRDVVVSEPFWPASPRFDALPPGGLPGDWFLAAAVEMHERTSRHSGFFRPSTPDLAWLCASPFASAEMERRLALQALSRGGRPHLPDSLSQVRPDNRNARLWANGSVETIAGEEA